MCLNTFRDSESQQTGRNSHGISLWTNALSINPGNLHLVINHASISLQVLIKSYIWRTLFWTTLSVVQPWTLMKTELYCLDQELNLCQLTVNLFPQRIKQDISIFIRYSWFKQRCHLLEMRHLKKLCNNTHTMIGIVRQTASSQKCNTFSPFSWSCQKL